MPNGSALRTFRHRRVSYSRPSQPTETTPDRLLTARTVRDRFGAFHDQLVRLFEFKTLTLRAQQIGLERVEVADRQIRLHVVGAMPKE